VFESNHWSPLAHVPVAGGPAVVVLFPMAGTASPLRADAGAVAPVPPLTMLTGNGMGKVDGSSLSYQTSPTLGVPVGALIPIAAQRFGVDPAVLSAPLITTLVDATGLVIYFTIAKAILGV